MIRRTGLCTSAVVMLATGALGNDSMAELKTGGLVFLHTDQVAMSEENLFISMDEVRVDYVFTNQSDKDVETVVAFPMPDVEGSIATPLALDDMEADNFLGFTVAQDGKPMTASLDQHAIVGGIDRTEELRQAKVPLLPYSAKTGEAIAALPEATRKDWATKGMVFADTIDAGKGPELSYTPLWTLRSTYWWKTTFPAGKTVRVNHRYKPSVGGTVAISFMQNGKPSNRYRDYVTRYCMDDGFIRTAAKLEQGMPGKDPLFTEKWLSYILKTGANWGGTIGKFKLTVDKGKPENFVSFCGEGVKKTSPTTFVMEKTDFYPDKDLDILILQNEGVVQ